MRKTLSFKKSHRSNHSAGIVGNYLFVFGGACCQGGPYIYNNELWCINIGTKLEPNSKEKLHWLQLKTTGDIPLARSQASLACVNKKLILVGGKQEKKLFCDIHILDLVTKVWQRIDPLPNTPVPLSSAESLVKAYRIFPCFGAGALYGLRFFVFGGIDNASRECNDLYSFDIVAKLWTRHPPVNNVPYPRSFHTTVVNNGK